MKNKKIKISLALAAIGCILGLGSTIAVNAAPPITYPFDPSCDPSFTNTSDYVDIDNLGFTFDINLRLTFSDLCSYISATDPQDGDITSDIVFENSTSYPLNKEDFDSVDISKSYWFVGTIVDSDGNINQAQFIIFLTGELTPLVEPDEVAPSITGIDTINVDVKNPKTYSDICGTVTATDEIDGVITNNILFTNTNDYPEGTDFSSLKVGTYNISAMVSNSSGVATVFEFVINVTDTDAPTITGTTVYTQTTTTKLSLTTIKNMLVATDGYDGVIPSSKFTIINDGYTDNYNKVGTYTITLEIADSSGNKTNTQVKIKVVDKQAPSITGPINITKGKDSLLTIQDILSYYSATDAEEGDTEITYENDTYTGNASKAGIYTIDIISLDSANNKRTLTVTINVTDKIAPVYIVDSKIYVKDNTILTREQVVQILKALEIVPSNTTSYITLYSSYFDTAEASETIMEAGDYLLNYNVKAMDGTETTSSIILVVKSSEDDGDKNEADKKTSVLKKIWKVIKTPFLWIWKALKWIINLFIRFFSWLF